MYRKIIHKIKSNNLKYCIVGLGYVGLPLCVELSKYYHTTAFDVNSKRINDLKKGIDKTNELSSKHSG